MLIQIEIKKIFGDGSEAAKKTAQFFRIVPGGGTIASAGGMMSHGMVFDINKAEVDKCISDLQSLIDELNKLKEKHGENVPGMRLQIPIIGGKNGK